LSTLKGYDFVEPDFEKWPIVKVTRNREQFISEVINESLHRLRDKSSREISRKDIIADALYLEKIRLTDHPWKIDPKDEKAFWASIKKDLLKKPKLSAEERKILEEKLLKKIINRYANEIAGKFNVSTFKKVRKIVPFVFSRLLNAASARNWKRLANNNFKIRDRINLTGNIELIRKLSEKGTLVLTPTHFSNLDPVLVGYGLDSIGLTPFVYGAGLNLYNNLIQGYYMNRLGAYKVDRRKKNTIYLETLKAHSRISMIHGCHSLFFPGGTRSRSGSIESKLKLGLLGTAVDAQYHHISNSNGNNYQKIYVIPLIISYHFVLEATSLIEEHLKKTGQEKYYLENDQFSSVYKTLNFIWDFFSKGSEITLSYGQPMDLFGNKVDENGISLDSSGREVDIKKYFYTGGELCSVPQRDAEYTRILGNKILEQYYTHNIVFSSHLVAFTAFEILKKRFSNLNIYDLLRLPQDLRVIEFNDFFQVFEKLAAKLHELAEADKVKLALHMNRNLNEVINHGINNLGIYHTKQVLFINEEKNIACDDMKLLYFYHNRMEGYRLEKLI
jgi:glycerol-3-phosphate O-acyltransferase